MTQVTSEDIKALTQAILTLAQAVQQNPLAGIEEAKPEYHPEFDDNTFLVKIPGWNDLDVRTKNAMMNQEIDTLGKLRLRKSPIWMIPNLSKSVQNRLKEWLVSQSIDADYFPCLQV